MALPYLRESRGVILNVLSTGARAAGLSLTKALATEFGPDGVWVVAMLVGIIRSGQITRSAVQAGRDVDEYLAMIADRLQIPLGRVGEPHEFGDTAAFLLAAEPGVGTVFGLMSDANLAHFGDFVEHHCGELAAAAAEIGDALESAHPIRTCGSACSHTVTSPTSWPYELPNRE